jgi:toxin ParE1/3/4
MGRVNKLPTARSDLIEIWRYIADDSPHEANRFLDRMEERVDLILENPGMGKGREEFAQHLRSFPVGNYVIFYRPLDREKGIVVVRVLNAARDIKGSHFE